MTSDTLRSPTAHRETLAASEPRALDVIAAELRAARAELIRATQARHDGEHALRNAEELALTRHGELLHELKHAALRLTREEAMAEWAKGHPL